MPRIQKIADRVDTTLLFALELLFLRQVELRRMSRPSSYRRGYFR